MAEQPGGFAAYSPKKRPASPGWKSSGEESAKSSRAQLAAVVFIMLLGLGGIIAGYLFYYTSTTPAPRLEALPLDTYNARWPENPWARSSAQRLRDPFGNLANQNFGTQQADKFRLWLDWLRGKSSEGIESAKIEADTPLLVYVSALGAANADGAHILLPKPAEDTEGGGVEWLPVQELLDALANCPAKGKLLVLDIAHSAADPFHGILLDDAAGALCELLDAKAKANALPCPVLVSCGPGQISLPCDPERMTAFAFFLREGLRGAAKDCLETASGDRIVSAGELARYVSAKVAAWSREVYGAKQVPRLYANPGDKLDLPVSNDAMMKAQAGEAEPLPEYPPELLRGWKQRDPAIALDEPEVYTHATAALLRTEEGWARAGRADTAGDAWREARGFSGGATKESIAVRTRAEYLREAAAPAERFRLPLQPAGDAKAIEALKLPLAAALADPPPGKGDEAKKALKAWSEAAKKAPVDAACLIWQAAVAEDRPTQELLLRWVKMLVAIEKLPQTAEVLLLDRLAKEDFEKPPRGNEPGRMNAYPQTAVRELLRAEDRYRRLAFQPPDDYPIVSKLVTKAENELAEAEAELYRALKYEQSVGVTNRLKAAGEVFDEIAGHLEKRRSLHAKAETLRLALLDTMGPAVLYNKPAFADWRKAADALTAYENRRADENRRAAMNAAPPEKLESVEGEAEALEGFRSKLVERFTTDAVKRDLLDAKRTMAAETAAIQEWLAGPALGGAERLEAWALWRKEIAKRHKNFIERDAEGSKRLSAPADDSAEPDRLVALRRAEAARKLLQLAGVRLSDADEAALETLGPATTDRAAWARAGEVLRIAFEALPGKIRDAKNTKDWSAAERMIRVLPPDLARQRSFAEAAPWRNLLQESAVARRKDQLNALKAIGELRDPAKEREKFFADLENEPKRLR